MQTQNNDDNEMIMTQDDEIDIINDFSSEIALDGILEQIGNVFNPNEDLEKTPDLFEIILKKYKFLTIKYKDNDDLLSQLQIIMDNISERIISKLQEKLHFTITFSDSLLFEDKLYYIQALYNFFISNIRDGLESLLFNYFINHISDFEIKEVNKKDLSYIQHKNAIENKYVNQIFNFDENIETIKTYNLYAEDIIELMCENDPEEVNNYWTTNILIDNVFVEVGFEKEFNSTIIDLAFNSDIPSLVHNKLITRFHKE